MCGYVTHHVYNIGVFYYNKLVLTLVFNIKMSTANST